MKPARQAALLAASAWTMTAVLSTAFAMQPPTASSCGPATSCKTPTCSTASSCAPTAPTCATSCATSCASPTGTVIQVDPAVALSTVKIVDAPAGFRGNNIGKELEEIRARWRVPGIAAAVVRNGAIHAAGVAGVRQAGGTAPIQFADPFHLGSCGKSFTATLAAKLVADNVIAWESTIADVFPEVAGAMHVSYRAATLAQLLRHRGGFPALVRSADSPAWTTLTSSKGAVTDRRRSLVEFAVRDQPATMPGAAFNYTDVGYAVAGAMLERAAATSWEELVRDRVARPLDLTSLGFGAPNSATPENQPWGHVLEDGQLVAIAPGPRADIADPV